MSLQRLLPVLTLSLLATAIPAQADDLVFMLDNQSSYSIVEFYASPSDVGNWEDDILGTDVMASGDSGRVTIADGREQCEYDLRIVFEDGDVTEDTTDLCETGSYTVTD
ncbi:hypothetical protein [Mesorhizobium sp. CAU 1732]|uniref:hypothetical protein n=1 Tax=Mesorhizobium sp. CAU 1732 TaxID=3140358 RepID=UPI00326029C6